MQELTCLWKAQACVWLTLPARSYAKAKWKRTEALLRWFAALGFDVTRIGLEAGPLSQWLFRAMQQGGLAVERLETRHVQHALATASVKTDRKDARGIAQLMRMGWFKPVHCKSIEAQDMRALLSARELLQCNLHQLEMSLRGILRGFGLKVVKVTRNGFSDRITELVAGHPSMEDIATAMLKARNEVLRQFNILEKRVRGVARCDTRARLLMSVPGVGPIVALTFAAAIDDPARFKSSKDVGAHFGRRRRGTNPERPTAPGASPKPGTARCGGCSMRPHMSSSPSLSKAAPDLKSWAMRLVKRGGIKKATVALARKLAVIIHRMLVDGTPFSTTGRVAPCSAP